MIVTPDLRIRPLNDRAVNAAGDYVLYWMIANRRPTWNFSLQRAVEWCQRLSRPLLVCEALRINYRWASDRLHRFVLQGMGDNKAAFQNLPAAYYCYVEPQAGHGQGLLAALAGQACAVVTDDFPCFFLPALLRRAARQVPVLLEAVDSNGLLPLRATDRDFPTAYAFRRFLQRELPRHLASFPAENPLDDVKLRPPLPVPERILSRWPPADEKLLTGDRQQLAQLAIDHSVGPAAFDGGIRAADKTLQVFLEHRLPRYDEERNHPDDDAGSGLSPYLHFGHVSAHDIFRRIAKREEWTPAALAGSASGRRTGWWGLSPPAESFLDQLITWRELGYNMCSHRPDYDRFESLPDWARQTISRHAGDPRPHIYSIQQLENADTHDPVWNAAQRQLVQEGRLHNYLRMLWGKKILEWTECARTALEVMIHLNNKYAVDGRDPNSYSGIFWVLGRYDRPWGPERPIFGKLRYMTSGNAVRKFNMEKYLQKYARSSSG